MPRHFSTKDFFRQIPNALLARYFEARNTLDEFDFSEMEETRPDPLFEKWLGLSDDSRREMDAEFQEIFGLSCEKGFRAILDEAEWHFAEDRSSHVDFVEKFAGLSNHFERAMLTFLDHKPFWRGATLFYHADTLPWWRKRKNLPDVAAAVDETSLQSLADLIRDYFHFTEGRGNNCVVEPFRRGKLDYFFAYPEDYSQQSVEWVDGKFGRRPHNPAFEVIFVYSQEDRTLDLNFRGAYKAIEPLQSFFVQAILKCEDLPPDPKDGRVYDLNPLIRRDFDFVYDAGSGIEGVALKKIRLSSKAKKGDRITLEADWRRSPDSLYDLLAKVGTTTPLQTYNVTQVELAVSIATDASKPPKTTTIRITHPNSCSLKYDERDLVLRSMLNASGIEPRELSQDSASPDSASPVGE